MGIQSYLGQNNLEKVADQISDCVNLRQRESIEVTSYLRSAEITHYLDSFVQSFFGWNGTIPDRNCKLAFYGENYFFVWFRSFGRIYYRYKDYNVFNTTFLGHVERRGNPGGSEPGGRESGAC